MRRWQKPRSKPPHLWQQPGWPALTVDTAQLAAALALTRRAQGALEGRLATIGFDQNQALAAAAWTHDALCTAAMEGERLDLETLHSSVAQRLGVAGASKAGAPRHVDGLLDVMNDASTRSSQPLTAARLQAWQAALFPSGYSGISKIRVGGWRDQTEPMQIVNGPGCSAPYPAR